MTALLIIAAVFTAYLWLLGWALGCMCADNVRPGEAPPCEDEWPWPT